jgi:hypothetical protein
MQETDSNQSASDTEVLTNSIRQGPTGGGSPSPGMGSGMGGGNFVMKSINSAIELVKAPVAYMTAHKDEQWTTRDIMISYVAVLAAIPFVATLIGDLWYYGLFGFRFAGFFAGYAFVHAFLNYILDIIAVYVVAIVIKALAPTFGSTVNEVQSLKMAAYIFTPAFLIGVLDIIPPLGFLTFLGSLYGLYILYLGLPIVIGTAKDKVIGYVIGVVVAFLIIVVIIGVIVSLVLAALFLSAFGLGFI